MAYCSIYIDMTTLFPLGKTELLVLSLEIIDLEMEFCCPFFEFALVLYHSLHVLFYLLLLVLLCLDCDTSSFLRDFSLRMRWEVYFEIIIIQVIIMDKQVYHQLIVCSSVSRDARSSVGSTGSGFCIYAILILRSFSVRTGSDWHSIVWALFFPKVCS